jgi:hypothetical protein
MWARSSPGGGRPRGLSHGPAGDERERQEQRPGPERRPDRQQVEPRRNAAVLPGGRHLLGQVAADGGHEERALGADHDRDEPGQRQQSIQPIPGRGRSARSRTGSGPSPRPRRPPSPRATGSPVPSRGSRRPAPSRTPPDRPSLCLPQPGAAIAPMARMMVRRRSRRSSPSVPRRSACRRWPASHRPARPPCARQAGFPAQISASAAKAPARIGGDAVHPDLVRAGLARRLQHRGLHPVDADRFHVARRGPETGCRPSRRSPPSGGWPGHSAPRPGPARATRQAPPRSSGARGSAPRRARSGRSSACRRPAMGAYSAADPPGR